MKIFVLRILLLVALTLSCTWVFAQPVGFVRRQGLGFVLDGQSYRYIGANYWYGGLLATQGVGGRARLAKELDFLQQHGITNLRVMVVGAEGLSGGYQYRVLQSLPPEQSKFDESSMAGLNYSLAELGERKMKAVPHFTNTWEWSGGLGQYFEWNGYHDQPLPKNPGYDCNKYQAYIAQFYGCEPCKSAVVTYIRYVLGRTNSLTHKKYVSDPAIMAWEIINEPRPMTAAATPASEQWVQQTAALVKPLDKNHLLTTGSEGDIATDNNLAVYERRPADPHIDYLTIHIWPENWGWFRDTAPAKSMPAVLAKAPALTKFGFDGLPDPTWWTTTMLPLLQKYPVSYALTWRNGDPQHYLAPFPGQASAADFKAFSQDKKVLMENRIAPLKTYSKTL